jgi:hypothetical protein
VWSGGVLPFDVIQQSNGLYVVHRDNNFRSSSFIDGDVVAPRAMTSAARAATFYGVSVQVGTQVGIAVVRGGRVVHISVTAQRCRRSSRCCWRWR